MGILEFRGGPAADSGRAEWISKLRVLIEPGTVYDGESLVNQVTFTGWLTVVKQ